MTQWTDERIPLWVPPVQGEALDSWIEAYARRLAVSGGEFTRFLGLSATDPRFMVRRLTNTERDTLARRTGLTPEALAAMTLNRFDGVVVDIDPDDRTMGRPPAWRHYGSRSRFCPACLADGHGRWPLSWRLPWSFACVRHELLLCDYCPACGHPPPVSTRGRGRPSSPGVCLHATQTGRAIRCGHPLTESAAPALRPDGAVLAAQLAVNRDVLSTMVAEEARTRGQELYVLARRALRGIHELPATPSAVDAILDDCGGTLPALAVRDEANDAHNTAVGTAVAVIATDHGHPACDEVFAWLLSTDRPRVPRSNYATSKISEWLPAGPRVVNRMLSAADSELTFIARLRYGTATPAPAWPDRSDEDVHHRASKMPAMIWPSWAFRLMPVETNAPVAGFRRACASLMLLPSTNWDYPQAASLLGNTSPKSNRRALDAALAPSGTETLLTVLPTLAKALDSHPVPIDYDRRRRLFSPDSVDFDHNAYQTLCRRHGWRPHAPVRIKRLRWLLARLLLGADPGAASRTPAGHLAFHYRLHPDLHELLHQQAAANLEAHGIDEPVSWEPPTAWTTDPGLPPGPETINRNQLAQHAANGPGPTELARLLGLDDARLLLAVETLGTTAPHPVQQRPPTPGRRTPRQGVLAPQSLKRLYQEQQLLQHQIAEQAGCSINTVRHALDEAGIPIRPRRPAGYLKKTISRTWLEKEYHHKGRSSPDIARELGVRKDDVMRLVNRWGIPRHPTSQFTNPFASLDTDLSPAMHAVSRTKNCIQRLRHLTVISRHRTLQDSAAELGVTWGTFNYQLKRIEETVGFTIIGTGRSRPLTITEDGRRFLDEATRLLSLLDDHNNQHTGETQLPRPNAAERVSTMPTFSAHDGTKLAYHVFGDGPPVVCLPGGPTDSAYLGDLGGLSAHHQLIRLDLRGTGQSATPQDIASCRCDRLVDDVEALRKHLGLAQMDLLAHCAGANLAALYVSRHQEKVSKLALITPSVRAVGLTIAGDLRLETAQLRRDEPWFPEAFAALEAITAGKATTDSWKAIAPFSYGRWDAAAQAHEAAGDERMNPEIVAAFGADGAFAPDTTRTSLAQFTPPVLLLAGEADLGAPPHTMAEFADLFPNAELVVQPGAGHYPWLDDADRFVATTTAFLGHTTTPSS